MARQPRFILPGYPQHVIQRGNNRHVTFADPGDYQCYLDVLAEACDRFRLEIECLLQRQAVPESRGGDRKSAAYRQCR